MATAGKPLAAIPVSAAGSRKPGQLGMIAAAMVRSADATREITSPARRPQTSESGLISQSAIARSGAGQRQGEAALGRGDRQNSAAKTGISGCTRVEHGEGREPGGEEGEGRSAEFRCPGFDQPVASHLVHWNSRFLASRIRYAITVVSTRIRIAILLFRLARRHSGAAEGEPGIPTGLDAISSRCITGGLPAFGMLLRFRVPLRGPGMAVLGIERRATRGTALYPGPHSCEPGRPSSARRRRWWPAPVAGAGA